MQPLFLFKLLGVPFFSFTTLAGLGILLALLAAASAHNPSLGGWTALSASAWVSAGALAGGDAQAASEAMRRHLTYGREELLEKLEARLRHMEQKTA